MKGFTLLEVLIALAITAGTVVTIIGSVNYHTGLVAEERELVSWTMIAREKLSAIERGELPRKGGGNLAPSRPDLLWNVDTEPTEYPGLVKIRISVGKAENGRKATLVRYIAP